MTKLGYQIPNFTYPGVGPAELFDVVAAQAAEADRRGFDTVLVMDHFYQLPMLGAPERVHARVLHAARGPGPATPPTSGSAPWSPATPTGTPPLLAKTVTTLDIVSGGRAQLGIGAGWFELEHDVARLRVRHLHRPLREARGGAADHPADAARRAARRSTASTTRCSDAINQPPPRRADPGHDRRRRARRRRCGWWPSTPTSRTSSAPVDEVPRKLDALAAHCERSGRDRSEITVTSRCSAASPPPTTRRGTEVAVLARRLGMDLSDPGHARDGGIADLHRGAPTRSPNSSGQCSTPASTVGRSPARPTARTPIGWSCWARRRPRCSPRAEGPSTAATGFPRPAPGKPARAGWSGRPGLLLSA